MQAYMEGHEGNLPARTQIQILRMLGRLGGVFSCATYWLMSSWLLKIFLQAIRCNKPENIMKNMTNWVVISWIYGEDQLAHREGSKLVQLDDFTWESQPTSPIQNSIQVQFEIQEKSTLNLMLRSHTTSN
jgi:hypothetical protein